MRRGLARSMSSGLLEIKRTFSSCKSDMLYFHFNALINALASTLFGIIAFTKNPRDPKNKSYAFYCFSLSLWSYSYVLWQLSTTATSALFFSRALMMGAILIPITHVHHLLDLFEWKAPRV